MPRTGFELSQLRRVSNSLDSPGLVGLPTVTDSTGIAESVREVLASAGEAAFIVGRQQRIASDEENAENIGIARTEAGKQKALLADDLLQTIRSEVASGNVGVLGDEALSGLVEQRVSGVLGRIGVNEAGEEAFRAAVVPELMAVATGARATLREEAMIERQTNMSAGFIGVTAPEAYDELSAQLKSNNPELTDADVARLAMDSLETAASTGNEPVFRALFAKIPDSPDKKLQEFVFSQRIAEIDRQTKQLAFEDAHGAIDVALRSNKFAAADAVASAANVTESDRGRLLAKIEVARNARHDALLKKSQTDFENELFDAMIAGDTVDGIVSKYVGLAFERADIPAIAGRVQSHTARKMMGRLAQLQAGISDAADPANPAVIAENLAKIELLADVAERMHDRYVADPTALDGLGTAAFQTIVGAQAEIAMRVLDTQQRVAIVRDLALQKGPVTGIVDSETALGTFTAREKLDALYEPIWESIQSQYATRDEQIVALAAEVQNHPQYESPVLASEFQNILTVAVAVANQPTSENMAALSGAMRRYRAVKNVNQGVAIRHVPDESRDLLEGIDLALTVWGENNILAVQAGIKRLLQQQVPAAGGDQRFADTVRGTLTGIEGLNEQSDGYAQVYSYASDVITTMHAMGIGTEKAAAHVKQVFDRDWLFYRGQAIRFRSADDKVRYDVPLLDRAVRKVYENLPENEKVFEADDLVLKPNEFNGRWMLHSVSTGFPIQWPPEGFTAEELLQIQGASQDFNNRASLESATANVEMQRDRDLGTVANLLRAGRDPALRVPAVVLEGLLNRVRSSTLKNELRRRADTRAQQIADSLRARDTRLGRFQAAALELANGLHPEESFVKLDPLGFAVGGGF